jgi:pimeloyl-ACP methyl ester carboxylesterase
MIHGSLCRHRLWDQQRSLASYAWLIMLDLPGHGESEPLTGPITISKFASIVAQLIRQLKLKDVILMGHSLGGAIALQLTLDYSELVKALILVGTGAKLGVLPAILEGLRTQYTMGIELTIGQLGFASEPNPILVELVKTECLRCDPAVGYSDFFACNNFDVRDRIHQITVPTLVMVGDEDQLTPVKWSQYLATNIPNAKLKIIAQAGHLVMLEQPAKFNQAIISFLRAF